jgi:hypothetical protein
MSQRTGAWCACRGSNCGGKERRPKYLDLTNGHAGAACDLSQGRCPHPIRDDHLRYPALENPTFQFTLNGDFPILKLARHS